MTITCASTVVKCYLLQTDEPMSNQVAQSPAVPVSISAIISLLPSSHRLISGMSCGQNVMDQIVRDQSIAWTIYMKSQVRAGSQDAVMLHLHVWCAKQGQALKCRSRDWHAIMVTTWLVHWPAATTSSHVLLTCSRTGFQETIDGKLTT